ncbi:MAG: preprotein translocase subunit SecY [Blastocatellales bacterium]
MFESFINAVRNLFNVPELRKRVLFTLGMLVIYRAGIHIPVPGVDKDALEQLWGQIGGNLLGVMDLFSGGNLRRISVFALGIMPYITASIILQLMTSIDFMGLKKVQEEGELGRRKITQYTRYLTVVLCMIQGIGISFWLQRQQSNAGPLVPGSGFWFVFIATLTLMTGTMFVMWLGEQITERGVGNGISLLIFAGIVVGLPNAIQQLAARITDPLSAIGVIVLIVVMVIVTAGIVFFERGTRKVPTNHTRRMVGRQMVATASSHLPLKVNIAGVIPVIFASSVLAIPQTLTTFAPADGSWVWLQKVNLWLGGGHPIYELLFISLIILFAFFYVSIVFNADEVAENLRKQGAFIPGIRPGKRTGDYLNSILVRLTTVGAIYLVVVCLIPQIMISGFKVQYLPLIGPWLDSLLQAAGLQWIMTGLGYSFYFGGTSLLIVVGVAMDTISQVEAQLVMRHYDGFLGPRGGRLRGRRVA